MQQKRVSTMSTGTAVAGFSQGLIRRFGATLLVRLAFAAVLLVMATAQASAASHLSLPTIAQDDGFNHDGLPGLELALALGLLVGFGFLGLFQWNRKLQRAVDRRNWQYAALNGCNEATKRCQNENELFAEVCRIAVGLGGMKMAWIGLIDPATQRLQPVTCFGRGLNGTAILEDRSVWEQGLQDDPRTARRRQNPAVVMPLYRNSIVVGAITVHAGEVGVLDESVPKLFADMAAAVGLALEHFEQQAALHKVTQQLQTIADHAPVALAQVDRELRYRFVNQNFANLHALQPTDIIGKSMIEVLGEAVYARIKPYIETVLTGRAVEFEREVSATTPEGTGAVVHVRLVPERDKSGRVIGYLTAMLDITARKAAEDQLRKLSQAVEQSSDSIIITDTNFVINYVNQAFVDNTGYSREEAIGQSPRMLQSGDTRSRIFAALWDALRQGHSWRGELHNRRNAGHRSVFVLKSNSIAAGLFG